MKSINVCGIDAGKKAAEFGSEALRMKAKFADVTEERITAFRRAFRRGRHAAEDFVDTAVITVRRQPLKSVGITFGVALAMGALVGRFAGRK